MENDVANKQASDAFDRTVNIIHFNDCYNVEPSNTEPCGGAARFKSAIDALRDEDTMVLFSGDILSPSIMSTFTKGEQMISVLNECRVDCAVYGNHDFDFGIENLESIASRNTFPWLISNVIDNETNKPLADGKVTHILERKGLKFGVIGLVEEEWLATLATIDKEDVTYFDFVVEGKKLAKQLKEKEKVDFVIALTHMRMPNDCRLAANVDDIDLILGGHDHIYEVKKVNGKYVIKSGTDFRQLSKITLEFCDNQINVNVKEVNITSTDFVEDEKLRKELEKYSTNIEEKMDIVLGQFNCDLDGRFSSIRTKETNLGNFMADIMLGSTHSDLAILNSGTLRSDRIHPKGDFKLRDLVGIMPAIDPMVVLSATGMQIWKALENGVSQWPKLEGRFPQVSGIQFAFDPRKPVGSRVDPKYIKIGDEYLDLDQSYRLVTKEYLHQGKDGYDVFKECEVLLSEEECPDLCTAIQNHFEAIKILMHGSNHHTRHRQSLVCVSRRHSIVKMHEMGCSVGSEPNITSQPPHQRHCKKSISLDNRKSLFGGRRMSIDDIEYEQCKLEPKVERRIIVLNDEILLALEKERKDFVDSVLEEVIPEEPEDSAN